jgi:hypothetical protein
MGPLRGLFMTRWAAEWRMVKHIVLPPRSGEVCKDGRMDWVAGGGEAQWIPTRLMIPLK